MNFVFKMMNVSFKMMDFVENAGITRKQMLEFLRKNHVRFITKLPDVSFTFKTNEDSSIENEDSSMILQ